MKRMVQNNGIAEMVIEPEKVKSKKGYTNSGTLTASNVIIEAHPTFTDVSPIYTYINTNMHAYIHTRHHTHTQYSITTYKK